MRRIFDTVIKFLNVCRKRFFIPIHNIYIYIFQWHRTLLYRVALSKYIRVPGSKVRVYGYNIVEIVKSVKCNVVSDSRTSVSTDLWSDKELKHLGKLGKKESRCTILNKFITLESWEFCRAWLFLRRVSMIDRNELIKQRVIRIGF